VKGNGTSTARRQQQHAARLAWLRARPELLAQLPSATEDVDPAQSAALDRTVKDLKQVRLLAPTAAPVNARWWIRLWVSELRGEPVSPKEQRWALRGSSEADL